MIITQTEESSPTQSCEAAVWVTEWRAAVAFRQSFPQRTAMQTHMHRTVGVCEGKAREAMVPSGQWAGELVCVHRSRERRRCEGTTTRNVWWIPCITHLFIVPAALLARWRMGTDYQPCGCVCLTCSRAHTRMCDTILHHPFIHLWNLLLCSGSALFAHRTQHVTRFQTTSVFKVQNHEKSEVQTWKKIEMLWHLILW